MLGVVLIYELSLSGDKIKRNNTEPTVEQIKDHTDIQLLKMQTINDLTSNTISP
jgi:hypothetical protein